MADEVKRGFGRLHCPRCNCTSTVSIDLDDLETCRCLECSEEFTIEDIRDIIAVWATVLAWLDTAPPLKS